MFTVTNKYSNLALAKVLADILVESMTAATLHLGVAPWAPNVNSTPGSFTEATFTGYTAATLGTWSAIGQLPSGMQATNETVVHFQPTATTVTNTVLGYWIQDNSGNLLGYDTFATPIPMDSVLQSIDIVLVWQQLLVGWNNTVLSP
jgi:hypothetical protein